MNLKRLKALTYKESLQVFRDPSSILIAFILPLILLFLMGYAVSLDARKIPIAIISKSNSELSQKLISSFISSNFFEVDLSKNKDIYLEQMQKSKIKAILTLNNDFGKNSKYDIQIITDGTEPNGAGLAQNYISAVIKLWVKANNIYNKENIILESRYWFNPPLSSRYFLLPGSIAIIMTLIGTLLTALVIAREWERGTMEALMATPATMSEILIGKLIPYFILGMFSMLLCFIVAYFWYKIPFMGSFFILIILSSIYLFSSLSIGLLISTLAKNQFVAAQMSLIVGFLPAFILSGFLFEIGNMPQWLQYITSIIPARYFVESLQTLFLAGNIYEIFIFDAFVMILISALLFAFVLKKSKKAL
ncbi:ABC transporter permease [Aliarcobacter butzleri]|uniref:ABC transporter permease n=1 Tax=Aliarcobacter butzleri TaxID=28197 RepID=UPI00125F15CC|nr:ABC transporter permease [Aliarcobacter butzleri]MCT7593950.1 ABC transporter permease [Aliarcobacter butzleri]MCT7598738.1 ABC transporter permease [Aliarcobacter butzleri]MCT7652398.1 ABC transporter permease [Aliarcobacter butzleri]